MLTEVILKVPKEISSIVAEISQTMYIEAIKEVMAKRLAYGKTIKGFERRY
jgi:hypothetical protein